MTSTEQTPRLCEEGHTPEFEIECETPDIFQAHFRWPPTLLYHVCNDCKNTKLYFQKYAVSTKPLPGVIVKNV
jgi:hypothetical protein